MAVMIAHQPQKLALLHSLALLVRRLGDHVNSTQRRFLPVPLKAAGADAGLMPCHGELGPRSSGGSRPGDHRGQPVTGLWEQQWQLPGWDSLPTFCSRGALGGVSRQDSL